MTTKSDDCYLYREVQLSLAGQLSNVAAAVVQFAAIAIDERSTTPYI